NYQIHTTPTGLYNSIGNIQNEKVKNTGYILGPSNFGLSIPGQLTLISLAQISTAFLLSNPVMSPNIDMLIRAKILQKHINGATLKFDSVQNEVEKQAISNEVFYQ